VTLCATGVGSLPGEDVREWCRTIAGELPEFPHLPELPQRGPGADLIGRTLGLLAGVDSGFSCETTVSGWRVTPRVGGTTRSIRRAQSWLGEDLDAAEDVWSRFPGAFKIQAAGPLTLVASVEASTGERLVGDPGATAEFAAGLAEALAAHIADVGARLPAANLIVQLDEPAAGLVLAGAVPSQSGWTHLRPVPVSAARAALGQVVDAVRSAGAVPVFHCCGTRAPVSLFTRAGATAIGVDLTLPQPEEELGEALESGIGLFAGVEPGIESGVVVDRGVGVDGIVAPLIDLLGRLGMPLETVADRIVLTPSCGLAGVSVAEARRRYELVAAAAAELGRRG